MDFEVKRESSYMEMIVTNSNNALGADVSVNSGLLNRKEAAGLAIELIYTAERLLPAITGDIENRLREARSELRDYLNKGETQ